MGDEELGVAAEEIEERLRDRYRPEAGDVQRLQAAGLPAEGNRTAMRRNANGAESGQCQSPPAF